MFNKLKSISGISNPWEGARVYYKKTTCSTMEDARGLASGGYESGTVVFAGYQKKGRGRFGNRKWLAARGKNLLFSMMLDSETIKFPLTMLPLVLGYGVSLCLEETCGIRTLLKWPNDVLADCKKIAGILCESEGGFVVAGIGINCNQKQFAKELKGAAASVFMLTGMQVDMHALLQALIRRVHSLVMLQDPISGIEKRLAYMGERVRVIRGLPNDEIRAAEEGTVAGIGDDGELVIEEPSGKRLSIVSGSIEKIEP